MSGTTKVDCTDLAAFMNRLGAMRKADDSVILELNDALPTESFHPVDNRAKCEQLGRKVRQIRAEFEVEEVIGARTRKAVNERCGKIF
uniref:Protein MIX23 n=1 Tax=Angiostrongylus cantonensis TaxID=6313 RepID=A0A0K0CYM8_ANGCA